MQTFTRLLSRPLPVLLLAFALLLSGCFKSDEVAKKEYVEKGNDYFSKGKLSEAGIMYQRALQKDKRYAEAWYRLALLQLKQNQAAEAIGSLRRVVELDPKHPEASGRLLDLYGLVYQVSTKDRDAVAREIENLVKNVQQMSPESFDAYRGGAIVDLLHREPAKAIDKLKKAMSMAPDRIDAALAYVQALAQTKQDEEAEKFAREFVNKYKQAYPMYDVLLAYAVKRQNATEVENILVEKMNANPKEPQFRAAVARLYAATRQPEKMKQTLQPLLDNTRDFPNGRLLVGDFYSYLGNREEATKLYTEGWRTAAKELRPSYGLRLAETQMRDRKLEEAEKTVDEVLALDKEHREGRALKALMLLDSGKADKRADAMKRLNDLVNADPRNSALRFHLGRAQVLNNEVDAAINSFQLAIRANDDNLLARQALAEAYFRKNDMLQVVSVTNDILQRMDTFLPARLMRADALLAQGKVAEARADIEKVVATAPNLPETRLVKARLDLAEGRPGAAEEVYRDRFNQNDPRAFRGLVRSLVQQRKFNEAMEIVQVQIASRPDDLGLAYMASDIAIAKGKEGLPEAEQILLKAVKNKPTSPGASQVYSRLSGIQADLGRMDEAIKTLQVARQLDPKNVEALIQLGQLYERRNDRKTAVEMYRSVLAITSNQVVALNNLAYTLADTNQDLDNALNYARQARQQLPDNLDVADTLGYVYLRKNLNDSAIQLYKEIYAKNPKPRALIHYHMGMAYAQKGDKGEAKRYLNSALQAQPTKEEEGQIRALLSKLG